MSGSIIATSRSAATVDADNASNRIEPGQSVGFDAVVRNGGVDSDPTNLEFSFKSPGGVSTTYVFGTDPEVVRNGIGQYHIEVPIPALQTSVGTWTWTWTAYGFFSATVSGETHVADAQDAVVITLQDPDMQPIKDALITVFRRSSLVTQKRTNELGVAEVMLEDGTYQVEVTKDGFRAPVTSLVVAGVSTAVITAIDLKTHAVVPIIKLCRIYGYVLDVTGRPVIDADVLVEPMGVAMRAYVKNGNVNQGITRDKRMIRARGADGYWEIDLVCGSTVRINIPSIGIVRLFRVPDLSAISLSDVRTDVSPASLGQMTGDRFSLI